MQKVLSLDSGLSRIFCKLGLSLRGFWYFAAEHADCGIRKWVAKHGMDDVIADRVTETDIRAAYPMDAPKRDAYKAVLHHLQQRCRTLRRH